VVFADYVSAVRALQERCLVLEDAIAGVWPQGPWGPLIGRLGCIRGIDTVAAFGLCSETGGLERFEHPDALARFLGLPQDAGRPDVAPGERPAGVGAPVVRAGSRRARGVLLNAAAHYRYRPAVGVALARRQAGQDPRACEISWRAQRRLHEQYRRLRLERGEPAAVVTAAIARELCTYVWELSRL
jgi:hypothetical protein